MYRTPAKPDASKENPNATITLAGPGGEVSPSTKTSNVRKSIGEWESGKPDIARTSVTPPRAALTTRLPKPAARRSLEAAMSPANPTNSKPSERVAEARSCLIRAKQFLSSSRNTKNEIKQGIIAALDRMYQLIRDSNTAQGQSTPDHGMVSQPTGKEGAGNLENKELDRTGIAPAIPGISELSKQIAEHAKLLRESKEEMTRVTELMKAQQETLGKRGTYASVTAGSPIKQSIETAAMHSVVITSKDSQETGDQVFQRIREVVNATEEGVRIDRIRKGRDRKVILGCRDKDEMRKVKSRIEENGGQLSVEEIKNKDPLIVLYSVLKSHTDESIIKAIKAQNKHLLSDLCGEEDRMEIRFRRKARNPLTAHIVAKVSPQIWQRLTKAGVVHIDVQRIRVADQSPLIQCSRCLGYGHGKRFCTEAVDVCSHCGGAHMKAECPDRLTEVPPSCVNCQKARINRADHNAFDSECPVRRKWDAFARSTVAYC